MSLSRSSLEFVLAGVALILMPDFALAQAEIRVGPNARFVSATAARNANLGRILVDGTVLNAENVRSVPVDGSAMNAESVRVPVDRRAMNAENVRAPVDGTVLNAENVRSVPVVMFAVRIEQGKVVSRGETATFTLDPRRVFTSEGMLVGQALKLDQLRSLAPVGRLVETVGKYYVPASKGVSASDLTRYSSASLVRVLTEAFAGASGGVYGGGGARGAFNPNANMLVIAVVPANPQERARYRARPLALVY